MISFFQLRQDTLDEQKKLIRQQIMELGSALFYAENSTELQLPVHVINNVQVDDGYQVWFIIHRPAQALSEFDAQLPAKLDFFKKGLPYQIKVKGIASIVDDAAKVSELAGNHHIQGLVAIRVTISATEYIGANKPAQSWFQLSRQQLSTFLFS